MSHAGSSDWCGCLLCSRSLTRVLVHRITAYKSVMLSWWRISTGGIFLKNTHCVLFVISCRSTSTSSHRNRRGVLTTIKIWNSIDKRVATALFWALTQKVDNLTLSSSLIRIILSDSFDIKVFRTFYCSMLATIPWGTVWIRWMMNKIKLGQDL